MTTLEEIDKEIETQKEVLKILEDLVKDKHCYGRGEWKELERLKTERDLILTKVKYEHQYSGVVLIEDKFLYALYTGKWRVKWKNKWYRSKNIKHFIDNYVKKEKVCT